jgi:3alpha(or 20beta)-hydroxysteroid dehydrogenase
MYGMRAAIPAPGYVGYTASKGAVIAMTKVAALEHAHHNIRINAICPGPVRTTSPAPSSQSTAATSPADDAAEYGHGP